MIGTSLSHGCEGSFTVVAHHIVARAAVGYVQHAATTATTQQPTQQRGATTTGFHFQAASHVRVSSNHGLIPFVLLPGNVGGMMVAKQDTPFLPRLVMTVCFPRPSIADPGAPLGFAKHVSAGIERVC